MNILHITPYYAPAWAFGGVVRAVSGLAEAQVAAGHHVVVLTTDAGDRTHRISMPEETLRGVHIVRRPNLSHRLRGALNLSTPLGFAAAARRLVDEHSIDLVHAHELRTMENLMASARSAVPWVVSPHGTLPYGTGQGRAKWAWDRLFGRGLARRMAHVLALTESEAAQARRLWSELGSPLRDDQVSVVPNGVELIPLVDEDAQNAFRQRWGLGDDPVIVYLGRLAERKRIPLLLSAFAHAIRSGMRARLLVAGPDEGVLHHLWSQARGLGLEDAVRFTGMLDDEDRITALQSANLFVLPSTGEGASVAVLEALSCGLPVLLTEGCDFQEATSAGAGMTVPATVKDLAGACLTLMDDPHRRAVMGRRGRELIRARYTWPRVADEVEAVYEAVLHSAHAPAARMTT